MTNFLADGLRKLGGEDKSEVAEVYYNEHILNRALRGEKLRASHMNHLPHLPFPMNNEVIAHKMNKNFNMKLYNGIITAPTFSRTISRISGIYNDLKAYTTGGEFWRNGRRTAMLDSVDIWGTSEIRARMARPRSFSRHINRGSGRIVRPIRWDE